MKKRIIIDFLNEHWDEFTALLSGTATPAAGCILAERFPDDLCEFAGLLSKLISAYRIATPDKRLSVSARERFNTSGLLSRTEALASSRTNAKGLLEKAQQFLKHASLHVDKSHSPIVMKNGLFLVEPQQDNKQLDTSFKNLVDSVL